MEKAKQVLEKALEVTKLIKNEGYQSSTLRSITEVSTDLGDAEKAKQVLEKALEVTKLIKNEYYQSVGLSSIAQSYLGLGDRSRALIILSDITRQGKIMPNKANLRISALHAEFGNWGEALYFARQCTGSGKSTALTEILRIHAEQQHPEFKELRVKSEE